MSPPADDGDDDRGGALSDDPPKTAVHEYPYRLKPGSKADEYREFGLTLGLVTALVGLAWMLYSGISVHNVALFLAGVVSLYFWFPLDELRNDPV